MNCPICENEIIGSCYGDEPFHQVSYIFDGDKSYHIKGLGFFLQAEYASNIRGEPFDCFVYYNSKFQLTVKNTNFIDACILYKKLIKLIPFS